MEFSWWAALYARLGAPNPILSLIIVSALGALLTGGCWWVIGEDYKRQRAEREQQQQLGENLSPELEDAKLKLAQLEERFAQVRQAAETERAEKERERAAKEVALRELDDRAKRKAISEALGRFMIRGRQIQQRCSNEAEPAPGADADAWAGEVEKYLSGELGDAYVARFRSHAGLPMAATSIQSRVHRNVWSFMHMRLAQLEQFLQEQAQP